jgi:hypothetical protein
MDDPSACILVVWHCKSHTSGIPDTENIKVAERGLINRGKQTGSFSMHGTDAIVGFPGSGTDSHLDAWV